MSNVYRQSSAHSSTNHHFIYRISSMKYPNSIQQFFSLLRAGLWNSEVDSGIFASSVNWKELLLLANYQTVSGIVFDGLQQLKGIKCDRSTLMEWVGVVKRIEDTNLQLNHALAYLVYRYKEAALNPVILKGQAVAGYYTNPLHRTSGDIDLYFSYGYSKANDVLKRFPGAKENEATIYHKSFNVGGISIENHLQFVDFYSPKNKKAWGLALTAMDVEKYETQEFYGKNGKVVEVSVFSPQVNAIYLFLHLQHHLLQTGIGLRQVCDWACLWKAREQEIDKALFLKIVDMLPVRRSMTALAWIVENHLGLSTGIIPLDTSTAQAREDGEFLLEDIMTGGNFGRGFGFMDGFIRNRHLHNLRTYMMAMKRMLKIRRLCPSEVDAYISYWIHDKLDNLLR